MSAVSGLLQTIPILGQLTPEQLRSVAAISVRCTFDKGERLIRAGAQVDAAYYLIDGKVDCMTRVNGKWIGTPVPPCATLLELAMIVEVEASTTFTAQGPSKVLKLPRQGMHQLMQDDAALTAILIGTLTARLKDMADTMRDVGAPFIETKRSA